MTVLVELLVSRRSFSGISNNTTDAQSIEFKKMHLLALRKKKNPHLQVPESESDVGPSLGGGAQNRGNGDFSQQHKSNQV